MLGLDELRWGTACVLAASPRVFLCIWRVCVCVRESEKRREILFGNYIGKQQRVEAPFAVPGAPGPVGRNPPFPPDCCMQIHSRWPGTPRPHQVLPGCRAPG